MTALLVLVAFGMLGMVLVAWRLSTLVGVGQRRLLIAWAQVDVPLSLAWAALAWWLL